MLHFEALETARIDTHFDARGVGTLLRYRLIETALIEHRNRARAAHDHDETQRTFASTHWSAAGVQPAMTLAFVSVTHKVEFADDTNLSLTTVVMPLKEFNAEEYIEMPIRNKLMGNSED